MLGINTKTERIEKTSNVCTRCHNTHGIVFFYCHYIWLIMLLIWPIIDTKNLIYASMKSFALSSWTVLKSLYWILLSLIRVMRDDAHPLSTSMYGEDGSLFTSNTPNSKIADGPRRWARLNGEEWQLSLALDNV